MRLSRVEIVVTLGVMEPVVMEFTAIDFETANYNRASACSIALVRVKDGKPAERFYSLIKPPQGDFVFTYVHGITQRDVKNAKTFDGIWPSVRSFCDAAPLLVAHNATFDRSVLVSCCGHYGIEPPKFPFLCTLKIARTVWPKLSRHSLDSVCDYLSIPLRHHEAASDAEASAQVLLRAVDAGFVLNQPPQRASHLRKSRVHC